jgi:hypothetical protein
VRLRAQERHQAALTSAAPTTAYNEPAPGTARPESSASSNDELLHSIQIETLAVHAGYSPDPTTKSAAVPLYQTNACAFDSAQHGADLFDLKVAGNTYTRIMNPSNDELTL